MTIVTSRTIRTAPAEGLGWVITSEESITVAAYARWMPPWPALLRIGANYGFTIEVYAGGSWRSYTGTCTIFVDGATVRLYASSGNDTTFYYRRLLT